MVFLRQIQWDANDRMALVTDGPSSTEYRYDDSGNRAIERGPAGETAFVNPWTTTRNKNELFKQIWVDSDRIATQRDDGPFEETKRYFLHKDLQGSTNIVTDATGRVFQHHEYCPNGDAWIDEKITQFRTPYQFAGAYIDESRDIANMGSRWYDQNREIFYAPDPALSSDPTALLRKPAMTAAYAYAGSNPIGNIDPSRLEFLTVQNRAAVVASHADSRAFVSRNPAVARSIVDSHETRLPRGLVKMGVRGTARRRPRRPGSTAAPGERRATDEQRRTAGRHQRQRWSGERSGQQSGAKRQRGAAHVCESGREPTAAGQQRPTEGRQLSIGGATAAASTPASQLGPRQHRHGDPRRRVAVLDSPMHNSGCPESTAAEALRIAGRRTVIGAGQ